MKVKISIHEWQEVLQIHGSGECEITEELYKRYEKNREEFMEIQRLLYEIKLNSEENQIQ
jgi:hypothetical protein